jgi:hypothetical protein
MHWIGVGILIWIGLTIAPVLIGLALVALPSVIFVPIGAILGFLMTDGPGGGWLGAAFGAFVAYKILKAFAD